jgi:choline dehydrogenase-like flavoprotein
VSVVVIGSGPAGVAAAHALCAAGREVLVLDAGDTIEPGRMEPFDALARSEPERWPPALLAHVRDAFPADVRHVPLKPAFGSLFPYVRDGDPDLPLRNVRAEALCSLARGGLSNAWGASILPFRAPDIAGWPIALAELAPNYEAVQRFVPVAAERDELAALLPLYTDRPGALRRGPQARALLAHLRRHTGALRAAGFTFGASRLAVATAPEDERRCRHSGLCLYGCPYSSVYNAAQTLDALVRTGRARYRPGVYVERLREDERTVTIDFHERRHPGARGRIEADRVFVACGAISSTRLLLASMGRSPCTRELRDSQYFVLPCLTARAARVSVADQGNTLAQVFLEVEPDAGGGAGGFAAGGGGPRFAAGGAAREAGLFATRSVHLQVYGYNDIMLAALARRLPFDAATVERLLAPMLGRLVVVQGFLHSEDSPRLTLHYDGDRAGVRLVGADTTAAGTRVRRLARYLLRHARLLGMAPVPGLAHLGLPGKSNHLGGSLPMRRVPGALESDTLGRVRGWQRVHVVDAAVFPSLPATTVTLSVMANAHRIASAAARLGG